MRSYLYDGTPIGLLTALAAAIEEDGGGEAEIFPPGPGPGLFTQARRVPADPGRAAALLRYLAAHLPPEILAELFPAFFAGESGAGMTILDYLRLLLRTGGGAAEDWGDERVRRARLLARRVRHEVHRLHGFIRFRRLADGTYYAAVSPDHAVLPLLAPHFAARFADQRWLIHDTKRNSGLYYDGRRVCFLPAVEGTPGRPGGLPPSEGEEIYERLFREYFRRIAVPERRNERLQRQRVPLRYRRNMVEMREPPSNLRHDPGEFGEIPQAACDDGLDDL